MRILFLTDNFPPEVNAPASRTFEHCSRWVEMGHEVTVVTCAPNFPKGKVFKGYRNSLLSKEHVSGIEVVRVWSFIAANEGFALRTLDYMSFMASAILTAPFLGRTDVVVATSPQFFTACAGWVVSALKRRPFVFELRDIWPESIKAVGALRESFFIRMLEKVEMFLYRRSALIVSVTNSFRRVLASRGIDERKIKVVTNGVDLTRFSPRNKDAVLERDLGLIGCFVAGYIGTHGMAHGLQTLLDAAEILQNTEGAGHIRILLLGDGATKKDLQRYAHDRGLLNVLFADSVPKEEVTRWWSLLDVSIIHLRKAGLFSTVIPSKLFECMGMAIPVLLGVPGESAEIVRRAVIGKHFEPENSRELADRLIESASNPVLIESWKRNCAAAAKTYDRRALATSMLQLLQDLDR